MSQVQRLVWRGHLRLCKPCSRKQKMDADQRAAVEQYMAAAKEAAKASATKKQAFYL